jgi:ubiquinone/menaquinone biosynthesis C-methylase UbiE
VTPVSRRFKTFRKKLFPRHPVCPWWLDYALDSPVRRLFHNPEKILAPYVRHGQTVIDLGCGMGYFSLPLARMVGDKGQVIAVDIQQKVLAVLRRRAERAGVSARITTVLAEPDRIGFPVKVDFALAFWMVHEVPDIPAFLREVAEMLKPDGRFFLIEPKFEVSSRKFSQTIEDARAAGLSPRISPKVPLSRAMLFRLI